MLELRYPSPDLAQGAVRLRQWSYADLPCIAEAATDPRIPSGTTVPAQYSTAAARAFIERQWSRLTLNEGLSLAITVSGTDQAVGLISLLRRPQPDVGGIGYWIVPSARGNGYAGVAASILSTWALELGFARIEAWVEPSNGPSIAALKIAGFAEEGLLRSFLAGSAGRLDVLVFSRIGSDLGPVA